MSQLTNHFFELFGLPVAFDIDHTALKNTFLQLQKQHHPDNADDNLKAEQNTALINHAYQILSHDDSRAVYLLELANIGFNTDKSISDEAFLMQMMEHRMALEDADFDKDYEQIKDIGGQVGELLFATAREFNDSYQNQDWQHAQIQAQKLKFLRNLHDDCVEKLTQIVSNDDDDLYVWFVVLKQKI